MFLSPFYKFSESAWKTAGLRCFAAGGQSQSVVLQFRVNKTLKNCNRKEAKQRRAESLKTAETKKDNI